MELKRMPEETELVIFDFYNTLAIEDDGGIKLREGVFSLMARLALKRKKIAISSSCPLEEVLSCPALLHIKPFVSGVYGKEIIIEDTEEKYKDLGRICNDFGIEAGKAVLIGDNYNGIEARSAKKFNVPFIIIPSGTDAPGYDLKTLVEK